jgi:hypothetical protein
MKTDHSPTLRPATALLAGIVLLAAGIALARLWLPEWRGDLQGKDFYLQRYRELARQAGVRLAPGTPVVSLTVEERSEGDTGAGEPDPTSGLRVEVSGAAATPEAASGLGWQLKAGFSPRGEPLVLSWAPAVGMKAPGRSPIDAPRDRLETLAAHLMVAPGERLGQRRADETDENQASYALEGSRPKQHLEVQTKNDGRITLQREPGGIDPRPDGNWREALPFLLLVALPRGLGGLLGAVLFFFLLSRRRIDFATGILLGAVSFAVSVLAILNDPRWPEALGTLAPAFFLSLWLVLSWSTGESFLRSVWPGFTTSLDTLRTGRLGPRGGRALIHGFALGAALAGLRLALLAVAEALGGAGFASISLRIPPLNPVNPWVEGIVLASAIAAALALTLRFLPRRHAGWAAAVLGGLVLNLVPLSLSSVPVSLFANLIVGGFLVWILRRFGLTALLVSAVVSFLLPAAIFSGLHLSWLPLDFAVMAGLSIAILVLGWVGLGRPEQIELEGRKVPAFIRRIEEERRLSYEMDLLARMQLGLLPAQLPEVPGWEIAVRSLLATEAGGDLYDFLDDERGDLWIAAGDVAGHGYSCSIAQAMTAAALSSLVGASQTPSGVLQRIDRVLRRNGANRNFTTLALLRLDPKTGEGRLANAGHPFPLLVVDGEAAEVSMAGLPLGQGPKREYKETVLQIPPGGALVFCSDGLFEGADWQSVPYGYERPRELLRTLGGRPAAEILEALLADWRRHLGAQEHQDDTTVVVVKRTS